MCIRDSTVERAAQPAEEVIEPPPTGAEPAEAEEDPMQGVSKIE